MFDLRTASLKLATALLILSPAFTTLAQAASPSAGQPAPTFTLKDQDGAQRNLTDFRGKWLVLYFYPKDDTPGCTTEACNFRDGQALIQSLGAQVVGVSIGDSSEHKAFADKHKLPFPLLADEKGTVARQYGALADYKIFKYAKRETFLIDPQGLLRKAYTDVDPDTHAQQVLTDLRGLIAPR